VIIRNFSKRIIKLKYVSGLDPCVEFRQNLYIFLLNAVNFLDVEGSKMMTKQKIVLIKHSYVLASIWAIFPEKRDELLPIHPLATLLIYFICFKIKE